MRGSCYNTVSFLAKVAETVQRIIVSFRTVFLQGQPPVSADGHSFTQVKIVIVFDDMNILNTKTVATAQYCTGVMGLVYILQNHCKMACTFLQYFIQGYPSFFGNKIPEIAHQFFCSL